MNKEKCPLNKDFSFDKIDFTKLLLWLCLLAVVIFGVWAAFIIPSSNYAKLAAKDLAQANSTLEQARHEQDVLRSKLKNIEDANAEKLEALVADFDRNEFLEFCNTFFDEAELEDDLLPDAGSYENYRLLVSAKLSSPSSFYDFLESVNNYSSIVRIDFPIVMKRSEDRVRAQFNIKVYKGKILPPLNL